MPKFKVNDASKNCYGCRVSTEGIDTDQFLKNPIMLYDHDSYKRLPIGTWKNLTKDGVLMFAEPVFDEDDEFAMKIAKKVDKDIIRMASISVEPIEWEEVADGSLEVTKSILREISITPFGGNKNAFKLYDKQGNIIELSDAKSFLNLSNNKSSKEMSKENSHQLLCVAMNLSDNTTANELVAKVLELNQKVQGFEAEKAQWQQEKQSLTDKIELADKESLISKAIEEKRITLAQKDSFINLSMTDLKNVLGAIPKAIDLSNIPSGGQATPSGRENWTFNDYSKKDPEGLAQMKLNDSAAYSDLFEKQFGVKPQI